MADYKYLHSKVDESALELARPRLLQHLEKLDSEFLPNIKKVGRIVEHELNNEIPKTFPHYTLHNINHSIRIMENMFESITDIEQLSELDLALLIYSALLHDVGMSVTDEEKDLIKAQKYTHSDINYQALLQKFNENDTETMQDYIRRIHAKRSALIIRERYAEYLKVPSNTAVNFIDELCIICEGHTQDVSFLKENLKTIGEKGRFTFNPLYCALLLRIGDIADCGSQRTPPILYKLISPKNISEKEWKGHFVIENSQIIKTDQNTREKFISIYGECSEPNIHRKVLEYIEWINDELINAVKLTSNMQEQYHLKFQFPIQNHVNPKGYSIPDLKLNLDFKSITNLLMGENIYGSKKLALREIIQNSIDACKVRKEIEENNIEFGDTPEPISIKLILDQDRNQVIVKDNGTGMTMEVLKKYFLNIGVSYYKSDDFILKNFKYSPIGNYGIGFLACFMLSKEVTVKTRHFTSSNKIQISLTKESPYICLIEEEDVSFKGTEIIFNYEEFLSAFKNDVEQLKKFMETYFLSENEMEISLINKKVQEIYINKNKFNYNQTINDANYAIDLNNYLNDVEGYIFVDVKKNIVKTGLTELKTRGIPAYYDGQNLEYIDLSKFDISKVYKDNTIRGLKVDLVTKSTKDKFDVLLDLLEDYDETFDKLSIELDSIFIMLDKSIEWEYDDEDSSFESKHTIFNELVIGDLAQDWDIAKGYSVYITPVTEYLYFDEDTKLLIPFVLSHRNYFFSSETSLFVRNILINNSIIRIKNSISGITFKGGKINIINENILPDISRNQLNVTSQEMFNYALGKVILIWAINNLPLKVNEKEILEKYIKVFYPNNNVLLKNTSRF